MSTTETVRSVRSVELPSDESSAPWPNTPDVQSIPTVGTVTVSRIPARLPEGIYLGECGYLVLGFRDAHTSVRIGDDGSTLYVQCVDAYGYQREISVRRVARSHESYASGAHEITSYVHPGRRYSGVVSRGVARRFVSRFRELITEYPTLLVQTSRYPSPDAPDASEHMCARADGLVRVSERMLLGELSVTALP